MTNNNNQMLKIHKHTPISSCYKSSRLKNNEVFKKNIFLEANESFELLLSYF